MNDWTTFRLGDVCSKIGSGATPRGGDSVYLGNGPYALIRSQNIYNDGFHREGLAYIGQDHAMELNNVEVKPGDVLLNITGDSVARCCQVSSRFLPARVNQHVSIVRTKPDELDARFLRFWLVSPTTQARLHSWAGGGGTRNALTKAMIEALDVWAPADLDEQREIASILGALEDKIELNNRNNFILEGLFRSIFESWFVRFDAVRAKSEGRVPIGIDAETSALFPDSFGESLQGEIPASWRLERLGTIGENYRRTVRAGDIVRGTPYIALDDMPRKSISLSQWNSANKVDSNKFEFLERDILFGKLRPYFHKVGVAPVRGICSTDILVLRAKSPQWYGFLLGHLSSEEFIAYTDAASTGTKMPRTNWPDMSRYEVALPSEEIAGRFSRYTDCLIEGILKNIHESQSLADIYNQLLPRLISGDLRLSDARRFTEVHS